MMEGEQPILANDLLCERKVLCTILNQGILYDKVAEILSEECFYDGKCIGIWHAMSEVRKKGNDIDIISVSAQLAKEGSTIQPWEVIDISNESPSPYEIEAYSLRLKELSLRRRLWYLGQRLINAGVEETSEVEDIQQFATEELNGLFDMNEGTFTLTDALLKLSDIIYRNMSNGSSITGTRTGFKRLDEKGGLQPSDLIIIAGETSSGKSSMMLSIADNAIDDGAKIAIYSLEMTKEQLAARLVSMKSGISSNNIMYSPNLSNAELSMIDKAKGQLKGENLFFDDSSTSNIESILISIRNMKIKHDISGACVDYLQILSVNQKGGNATREQQMGDASRRLKNLAKELNIWIIALSQLNRNGQDPVPNLARLRDSGQIAEAADVVIFIYRPEVYHRTFPQPFESIPEDEVAGKAMIDVAKGRNIGVFQFIVNFSASTTHFTDMDDEDDTFTGMRPVEEDAPF